MSPDAFLREGAGLMAAKLEPRGFRYRPGLVASGSGGPFAEGAFIRVDRKLLLWARFDTLGGVEYRIADIAFDHRTYMKAMGQDAAASYPGLPDEDPLGGFRRLLADLDLCGDFLDGDSDTILRLVAAVPPARTGFAALSS